LNQRKGSLFSEDVDDIFIDAWSKSNEQAYSKKKMILLIILFIILPFIMLFSITTIIMNSFKPQRAVSVNSDIRLIPSGQAVCMKLRTNGVLVVGVKSELPAKLAGIKNGDIIKKVNGIEVLNTRHFEDIIKASRGESLSLSLVRKKNDMETVMKPALNESEQLVCGMWLRDSAAGIGTITFVTEDQKTFGALGHPVNDCDVDRTYDLRKGTIEKAEVKTVKKGMKNSPGELIGMFMAEMAPLGNITSNNEFGIYGQLNQGILSENEISYPVLEKKKVKPGSAKIISTISQKGREEFEIEIVRISDTKDNKDFIIKITDEELLNLTGGIVQGMSGSPILQDGFLVGAVTHVMLNDPKKGYGISIEKMLPDE